ncbi:MAG: PP2C family serine/threonine-protein phosphatase [Anaerolineae bacterium]
MTTDEQPNSGGDRPRPAAGHRPLLSAESADEPTADGVARPLAERDASLPEGAPPPADPSRQPSSSEPWRVVAASVTGTSHAARGVDCQDAHAYVVRPDGTLILAVADGAGSADQSADGARIAVERVIEVIDARLDAASSEDLARAQHGDAATPSEVVGGVVAARPPDEQWWRGLLTSAVQAARARIDQLAEHAGLAPRAYACTLTCVVATSEQLAVAQIGDAAAVARHPDGALHIVGVPQRGEYANEAYFLTTPDAMERLEITMSSGAPLAVAAFSDGLLRLATQGREHEPHAPFFDPLLDFVVRKGAGPAIEAQLADFLRSERVSRRTDDDKTLVLAVRGS